MQPLLVAKPIRLQRVAGRGDTRSDENDWIRHGATKHPDILDDRALLDRLLCGDHEAPEEFVQRYGRLIYAVLRHRGISYNDIDDVYQGVFLHLWSEGFCRLRQWRGDSRLCTYIGAVAARYAVDTFRSSAGRRQISLSVLTINGNNSDFSAASEPAFWEPVDTSPGPEERLLLTEQWSAVDNALRQLAPRDAELLTRKHHSGQSYRAIAADMGMTVNHVGVALARAEIRLRRIIAREHPELLEAPTPAAIAPPPSKSTATLSGNLSVRAEGHPCAI